jgi:hypothetical protein
MFLLGDITDLAVLCTLERAGCQRDFMEDEQDVLTSGEDLMTIVIAAGRTEREREGCKAWSEASVGGCGQWRVDSVHWPARLRFLG